MEWVADAGAQSAMMLRRLVASPLLWRAPLMMPSASATVRKDYPYALARAFMQSEWACESIIRKRRLKMKKHKIRKRRKRDRKARGGR